jgi:hypothetical protein
VYPPTVSVQVFVAERFLPHAVLAAHSSTSPHVAVNPLPEGKYPLPQVHEYPPTEFEQVLVAERF